MIGVCHEVASVGGFQYILDPGKATPREQRGVHATLCGPATMKALHHRAFLGGHQAGALRADNPKRVQGLIGVQCEHACRRSRSRKRAGSPLRMKALQQQSYGSRVPDARTDLVTGDHRGDEVPTAGSAVRLGKRQRHGQRERSGVNDRFLVNVVELESVTSGRVH